MEKRLSILITMYGCMILSSTLKNNFSIVLMLLISICLLIYYTILKKKG